MWKWKIICFKILFFIIHTTTSDDVGDDTPVDLFNQDLGRDITTLEKNEPGFDYTNEEMVKLKIWPQGVIPYYIDTVSYDAEFRKKLDLFLESVGKSTGVQFLKMLEPPRDETTRWVFFINRRGVLKADSYTSKQFTNQGVQRVILGYDSPYDGQLYEIVLAILGIPPQNNAPDRDKHINVKVDNVLPDKKHLFDAIRDDEWLFHDLDYDFFSAGHYDLHRYSIGGFATIEPIKYRVPDGIGDGQGFSFTDVWKIRMMYNYISKTRSKLIRKSDCHKMFKPGPNFETYQPDKGFSQKPRKKPAKYLGESEANVMNRLKGKKPPRWGSKKSSKGRFIRSPIHKNNGSKDEVDELNEYTM